MKIKNILLSSIIVLNMFSFCSCSSPRTINTVGYVNLYNENLKTVKIRVLPGFNYENLTIPSYVKINGDDYKVTGLYVSSKDNEFFLKDNMYIKHVKVESEFISTFGYDVFRNTSLETLDISKATGLGQIGDHAFAYSSSLREVKMAPNVYKIYKGVFMGTNIKEINFTDTLEEIGINNFFNTPSLEKVNFGNTLKVIPGSTFEKSAIKHVYGDSINWIDSFAFKNTPRLETFNVNNAKYIGKEAFYLSNIGGNIVLNDCVIKASAFRETNIESVSITNTDNIEYKAFGDCKNLTNVSLNGTIYKISSNAFIGSKITSIDIPDTCTFIGSEAFKDCYNLESVKLPSSIESISSDAFRNCTSLTSIEIPTSIKRIYSGAFLNTKITRVTLSRNVEVMENAFPSNCVINYRD